MPKCNRATDRLQTKQECCANARDQRRADMRHERGRTIGSDRKIGVASAKSSMEEAQRRAAMSTKEREKERAS